MKWIRLNRVSLKDFRSYEGEHTVSFPETGLVLIKGLNKDTGGGSASGKTALLHAIQQAFDGSIFPSTTHQSWYSEKKPKVSVELTESDNKIFYSRKELIVNGESIEGGSKIIKEKFFGSIGLDSELLKLATFRGQRKPGLFFSMPDAQKKSFLTKVLNLHPYEEAAEAAAEKEKGLSKEFDIKKESVLRLKESLAAAEESLKECRVLDTTPLKERREKLHQKYKVELAKSEEINGSISILLEQTRQKTKDALTEIRESFGVLDRPDTSDLDDKLVRCKEKEKEIKAFNEKARTERQKGTSRLEYSLKEIRGFIKKEPGIRDELGRILKKIETIDSNQCPTCEQDWHGPDKDSERDGLVKNKASCEEVLSQIEEQKKLLIKTQEELDSLPQVELHKHTDKVGEIYSNLLAKKDSLLYGYNSLVADQQKERVLREKEAIEKIEEEEKEEISAIKEQAILQNQICSSFLAKIAEIDDLLRGNSVQEALASERKMRVSEVSIALTSAESGLLKIEEKLNLERDIIAAVGKTGFLGLVFDQVLEEAAAITNDFLGCVANTRELTLSYHMDKEAQNGNVQRRITPVISFRGREVSFDSGLSGGMQSAVELAADLGLGEVVARRRGAFPGWLILDESFDGLGAVEKESCMEMLSAAAANRLVLVVDHASEFQGMFEKIINVECVDGRSRIV